MHAASGHSAQPNGSAPPPARKLLCLCCHLPASCLSQIEFYFSDSNLPRDKFLQEQVASNEEGYVDIALLCIFSRVRSLLSSTIADASAVAESTVADVADALEAAESLSLSEDRKRVKRAAPLKAAQEVRCPPQLCVLLGSHAICKMADAEAHATCCPYWASRQAEGACRGHAAALQLRTEASSA
jgi:hypothetical protein